MDKNTASHRTRTGPDTRQYDHRYFKSDGSPVHLAGDQIHPLKDGEQRLEQEVQHHRLWAGPSPDFWPGWGRTTPVDPPRTIVLQTEPMAAFTQQVDQ